MPQSKNPATEEVTATFKDISDAELDAKLALAHTASRMWAKASFSERKEKLLALAAVFRAEKEQIGMIITEEMGRPLSGAIAEAEKCAWACEYYAEEAERMLAPEPFPKGAGEGEIRFEPLGVVFAVMPWNFPFWQVIRFLAPTLMAGNVGVMKHASNVPRSAEYLETLARKAGYPEGVFQNLFISIEQAGRVIDDVRVAAVTLTGSVRAGTSVGERSGRNIKKVVLELGGSDPFVVFADADIETAAKTGALARLQNAGQTCIAAKRFIVEEKAYPEFIKHFEREVRSFVTGDPKDPKTTMGPLATESILKGIEEQVQKSVSLGATLVCGGVRKEGTGYFYMPTILANVKKGMPAYDEEVFGPVASVMTFKSEEEAVMLANDTEFGLSSSVWSSDMEKAKRIAGRIEAGCVFINTMSKSDPRIPFGGVKRSGTGREMGEFGIKEFVNVKAVTVVRSAQKENPGDAVE